MGGRGASSGIGGASKAIANNASPKYELVSGYNLGLKERETAGELKVPKNGDVEWSPPDKKRPIYRSTLATSNQIGIMAEDNPKATIKQLYEGDTSYNTEAWKVLKAYMNKGYGEVIASRVFWYDKGRLSKQREIFKELNRRKKAGDKKVFDKFYYDPEFNIK